MNELIAQLHSAFSERMFIIQAEYIFWNKILLVMVTKGIMKLKAISENPCIWIYSESNHDEKWIQCRMNSSH